MDNQQLYDFIAKSLSAGMSDEEQVKFDKYLVDNPDQLKTYERLKQQWIVGGKLKLDYDVNPEQSWKKFKQLRDNQSTKVKSLWPVLAKIAAMILVTVGISYYFATAPVNESIQYTTGDNAILEVVLPDSSKVWLNESTVLTLSSDFNIEDRNVELEGEAYFEIERNERKPFRIITGETTTEVLGTSFNLDGRVGEMEVRIGVVSGKVSFSHQESELILTKGHAAVFNKENLRISPEVVSQNNLAWYSKRLAFEDQTLESVISVLEDYFEREIKLTTVSASTCLFTGEFEDPKIEEVLKVIAPTLNLTIEHKNNNYILSGAGCANN
jgi:ferric-dicitrate binding protein FerR (iron transport regulator)